MPITSLVVTVKTADRHLAGTDNDVFFDIGPLAWPLDSARDDFERNHVDSYGLALGGTTLFEEDIVWLRLQKKGIFGYNGTGDGLDGEWLPEFVELWVDGRLYARENVNQWLNVVNEYWVKQINHVGASAAEVFARTLRMTPNRKLSPWQESSGMIGSLAKHNGVSGWRTTSITRATVVGRPIRSVPLSTDGLATIDLEIEGISANGEMFAFYNGSRIRGPRFIRVEYRARINPWPAASGIYPLPAEGERVRISGRVLWDTDDEWWYEIHPDGPQDVELGLPARPDLRLTASYPAIDLVRKDKGTYHWEGMSSVPKGFEDVCKARDFPYFAFYYSTHARVELASSSPAANVRWYLDDTPLPAGSGTVKVVPRGGRRSTLPPFDGTDLGSGEAEFKYELSGTALDLVARPEDGNFGVTVRVEADDVLGLVTAQVNVSITGDDMQMDPAYETTSQTCQAAVVLARGNYRTLPLPVPRYDPQPWRDMSERQMIEIWNALHDSVLEVAHADLPMAEAHPASLTRQIQATLVAYPDAAAKIKDKLPDAIASRLRESIEAGRE